jgi:hypothetical protein
VVIITISYRSKLKRVKQISGGTEGVVVLTKLFLFITSNLLAKEGKHCIAQRQPSTNIIDKKTLFSQNTPLLKKSLDT